MRSVRSVAVLAAVVLLLAGCGKDDGTPSAGSSPPAGTSAPSTTAAPTTTTATATHGPGAPTITPGTILPGEDISPEQAAALQQSIDEGHQPWRVHPDMVAEAYVADRFGWDDVQSALADPHTVEITNRPDGEMVTLLLRQPVREVERGIWVVVSGVYLG
jgi:hypothetical protein